MLQSCIVHAEYDTVLWHLTRNSHDYLFNCLFATMLDLTLSLYFREHLLILVILIFVGRGRLFPDGKASISFCSDGSEDPGGPFNGFVMRASCFDPAELLLPGCVDYNFFRAWDPAFVNLIFDMFPPVRISLHYKL